MRTIGSSVGTAVIVALLATGASPQGLPTEDAFTTGFWACAGIGVLAVVAALAAPSVRGRVRAAREAHVDDLEEVRGSGRRPPGRRDLGAARRPTSRAG